MSYGAAERAAEADADADADAATDAAASGTCPPSYFANACANARLGI